MKKKKKIVTEQAASPRILKKKKKQRTASPTSSPPQAQQMVANPITTGSYNSTCCPACLIGLPQFLTSPLCLTTLPPLSYFHLCDYLSFFALYEIIASDSLSLSLRLWTVIVICLLLLPSLLYKFLLLFALFLELSIGIGEIN